MASYAAPVRIALVHDWLTGVRGGERVLDVIVRAFPDAEIHTLFHRVGSTTPAIEARPIHTSPLDALPGSARHYKKLLPLHPWAVGRLDVGDVDLVLSTSHAFAKAVRTPPGVPHLSYCFTPMRYVWDQIDAYLGHGLRRRLATPLVEHLRRFDLETSRPDHVDRFVAISHCVAERIERTWGREAHVLPPPVDLDRFRPDGRAPDDFHLLVSGFVPYKADALAIETFTRSGRPLVVAGDGPLRARLERKAGPNVKFLGRVDDDALAHLYARCKALVFPQEEDFGLIAVEAQASGRPVVAFGRGGALDHVRPWPAGDATADAAPTGVFFDAQTPEALEAALVRLDAHLDRFDAASIRRHAEAFGPDAFIEGLRAEIDALLSKKAEARGRPRPASQSTPTAAEPGS